MIELNVVAHHDFSSLSSNTHCGILISETEKVMYLCTRCQNAISLVISNKSAAVVLGMLRLRAWLNK